MIVRFASTRPVIIRSKMSPMRRFSQPFGEIQRFGKCRRAAFVLLLSFLLLPIHRQAVLAQTGDSNAIRVQSSEVLVPVMVLDEKKIANVRKTDPYVFGQELKQSNFGVWNDLAVRGLTAADFRVFEDGREQLVQRVSKRLQSGPPLLRDNLGYFWDFLGVGGGIWTVPVQGNEAASASNITLPTLPGYLVGYSPPPSPGGSCHEITVKTARPQSLVFSRREYCDTLVSAADPLKGTEFEKRLAADMASRKKSQIALSITTFAPFTSAGAVPVQIYLDFPSRPLVLGGGDCGEPVKGTIGLLGAVYTETGNLAARFSDFASQGTDSDYSFGPLMTLLPSPPGTRCVYNEPAHYRTEVSLQPGKYDLRVVLREGKKFGRAAIPVTVENHDLAHLAISGIAVVKRFRGTGAESHDTPTSLPQNFAPLFSNNFEETPAADARFHAGDPFCFYVQVYEPQESSSRQPKVTLYLQILDLKTGKVMKKLDPEDAAPYITPENPVIPVGGEIDVTKLPKGPYELQVQAADSTGATTPRRSAKFTIE